MIARHMTNVVRVTNWLFAGVTYSVYVGTAGAIAGWMVLTAVGPRMDYRSLALSANDANQALSTVLSADDAARRADSAECLLGLREILVGGSRAPLTS
jgi:hypothetical protein